MINRTEHSISGINFVPINRDELSLFVNYPDTFTEWKNRFTAENNVILPEEAYIELFQHFENIGVQQMPSYNISINGNNNAFFIDLYGNVEFSGNKAQINIKKFDDKNNIKALVDNTTFEYLHSINKITNADMVNIPYVVIPSDVGSRMLSITTMTYVLTKELIDRTEKIGVRVGDLLSATIPSVGVGVVQPLGNVARLAVLLALDIVTLAIVVIAMRKMVRQAFDLLLPPLREYKAMTIDRLLTIGLAHNNLTYSSSLKPLFQKVTILPIPIDFKSKKTFEMILGEDDRVLNRGYPTSSDSVWNLGLLIEEVCRLFNINPDLNNNNLKLEPKANVSTVPTVTLDRSYNDQADKNMRKVLDLSNIWNTKILSYQNDGSDTLLFDNPRGLRVEYKTVPDGVAVDDLTIIKGMVDIRFPFALGTIKKKTKFEDFLESFAKVSDKLLNTSFKAKIKAREGVLAVSQDAFQVTKILHQVGGKQTSDYLSHIGSNSIYQKYHKVDESKNSAFINTYGMTTRMDNKQFLDLLPNKFVNLEGTDVALLSFNYLPELATAVIDYREQKANWSKNMKTIKVYEE